MKTEAINVFSPKNPLIGIKLYKGHFTTNNSHISHYIDMSELKSNMLSAKNVARELAKPYLTNSNIDFIVCMESTEILAAYLAEELLQDGSVLKERGGEIRIVTPMNDMNGQLIFHHNVQEKIRHKNIILLVTSVSSGKTISRALDCLDYYGGNLAGISALFSAVEKIDRQKINSLFTCDDIPDYRFYIPNECEMCKEKKKLDAIVNSDGYTRL